MWMFSFVCSKSSGTKLKHIRCKHQNKSLGNLSLKLLSSVESDHRYVIIIMIDKKRQLLESLLYHTPIDDTQYDTLANSVFLKSQFT